jgi:hypothetical protein
VKIEEEDEELRIGLGYEPDPAGSSVFPRRLARLARAGGDCHDIVRSWDELLFVLKIEGVVSFMLSASCRLVGSSVVSGRPLRSHAVSGLSQRVRVGLGPVLASRAPSPPAAAAAALRGRGRVPITGWSLGGGGLNKLFGGEEEGGGVRSGPGEARTIVLLH